MYTLYNKKYESLLNYFNYFSQKLKEITVKKKSNLPLQKLLALKSFTKKMQH